MSIAAQNILPRKNDFLERHMNITREPNDARKSHRAARRTNDLAFCGADHLGFIHEKQNDRLLHGADRQWFVVAVEKEDFSGKRGRTPAEGFIAFKFDNS